MDHDDLEGYLTDLTTCPVDVLRERRGQCERLEAKVSYLRRLVQGRLDIVRAERHRRATGGEAGDMETLVLRLPEILGDKVHAPGFGRLPTNLMPPEDDALTADLDEIAGAEAMGSLPELSDAQLDSLVGRLVDLEAEVSGRRRELFGVIDALQSELVRRYQEGQVDPSSVLQ
jgi:hypothetical protein